MAPISTLRGMMVQERIIGDEINNHPLEEVMPHSIEELLTECDSIINKMLKDILAIIKKE